MTNKKQISKKQFIDKKEIGSKGITYQTIGTTLQALSVQLDEGEHVYSEAGKMSWKTNNVEMTTHGQGCSKMLSRLFTSESIFVNKFSFNSGTGLITFTTDQAGKIIPLDLKEDTPGIIFQKGAYLCSEEGIERKVALTKKLSAGLFGGKGFILQKVEGQGKVHLVADGEAVLYELAEGQEIAVDQGNLVAYEDTVDFDIQTVKGPRNWLFGGEGFFLGVLKGPGKVWLQTRKFHLTKFQSHNTRRTQSFATNQIVGCLVSLAFFGCIFGSILLEMITNK
jgi:uncharacterized protein (TIGR00266 family)